MSSSDEGVLSPEAPAAHNALAASSPDRVTMIHKPRKQDLDSRDLPGYHEPSNMDQVPDMHLDIACMIISLACIPPKSSMWGCKYLHNFLTHQNTVKSTDRCKEATCHLKAEVQHIMMRLLRLQMTTWLQPSRSDKMTTNALCHIRSF